MEFDPKQYLKKKKDFDPRAYLESKNSIPQEESKESLTQDIKDVAASIGQGATLGFGPEIIAAAQAAGELATGEPELSDLGKLYRQYQKQREAEYEQVQKRSPILSTAGEIVGGFIPAIVSGGTSVIPSLGRMVATGAGMGALASLGGSKQTTEEALSDIKSGKIPEMAKDVAFGGVLGAAVPFAGKGLASGKKFAEELIADTPIARQTLASFKEGLKGKGFLGSKAVERLDKEALESASGIEQTVEKGRKFIQNVYKDVLNTDIAFADNEKKLFSGAENLLKKVGGGLEEGVEPLVKSELQKTVNTLANIREGTTVNAQSIKDAQKYLRQIQSKANLPFESSELFKQASDDLNNILKNRVKGYSDINDKFSKFEDAIETFVTGVPSESRSIMTGGKTEGTSLFKTAEGVVEKSELPFGMGKDEFKKLNLYKDELKNLQKTSPEILKSMGIENVDEYIKNIKSKSDIQSVARVIEKAGQLQQSISPLGFGYSGAYLTSNIAGRPLGAIGRAIEKTKLPDLGRRLYAAADNELYDVAKKLNESGYSHMGTALESALKDKSTTAKNAVLFSIMQNPKTRKQVFGEGEENE